MARKTTKYENPFLYDQKPGESTEQYYKRLAKAADQRLVRIEKLSQDPDYKSITKYSYARAMRDIKQWSGEDAKRFNTKVSPRNIKGKIADIRAFLEAPTSTKAGIESVYQSKADTINKKYGTNFNWRDLANYFEQGRADHADKEYGSKNALRTIAEIQKQSDMIKEQIEKHQKKHIVVDDPFLQQEVDKMLSDRKMNINQFL